MTPFLFWLTMTFFIIVCVFLILLILIQKGRGGGLASAFGGAGGNTAFGSKTGDVLTWATSIVFGVFILLAMALNGLANGMQKPGPGAAPPVTVPVNTNPSAGEPALPKKDLAQTAENTPPSPAVGITTAPTSKPQ